MHWKACLQPQFPNFTTLWCVKIHLSGYWTKTSTVKVSYVTTWSQVVTETLRSQPWDECTGSATTKIFCLNGLIKCLLPSGSCPARCTVRCFAVLPPLHLPEHLPVWRLQPSCHFWFIQCCFGLRRVLLPPRSCRVRPSGHLSIFISIVWRTCLCLVVAS